MAKEKKDYKTDKMWEESYLDKRKHDTECKHKQLSSTLESKDSWTQYTETYTTYQIPPLTKIDPEDLDHSNFTNKHSDTRCF